MSRFCFFNRYKVVFIGLLFILLVKVLYMLADNYYNNGQVSERIKLISEMQVSGLQSSSLRKESLKQISDVLKKEPNNVEALKLRFNIYLSLGMESEAYTDLAKVNVINPVGEMVLAECFYLRKIKVGREELDSCYRRSVSAFEKNLAGSKNNVNYLVSKILVDSSDRVAIDKFSNLIDEASHPLVVETYRLAAEEYLEKDVYLQLFPGD